MVTVSAIVLNDKNEKLTAMIPLDFLEKLNNFVKTSLFLKSLMAEKLIIEYNQCDMIVSSMSNIMSMSEAAVCRCS